MKTQRNSYLENPIGYVSFDRDTIALLTHERPSVRSLFTTIVSQAFTRSIAVKQEDGTFAIWGAGSRPWSIRGLAKASNLSINTVQYGLNRLKKLNLIERISNKLGTVIQAVKFYQYQKKNPNIGQKFEVGEDLLTHRGDTRVSKNDQYRSLLSAAQRSPTSYVDVEKVENRVETFLRKDGTTLDEQPVEIREAVGRIISGRRLSLFGNRNSW